MKKTKFVIGILILSIGLNIYLIFYYMKLLSDRDGYAQQERIVDQGVEYLTKIAVSCHPTDVEVIKSLKEFPSFSKTDLSQDEFTVYPFRFRFGADHKLTDVRFIGTIK